MPTLVYYTTALREVTALKELDVRPILEEGGEPFDDIMAFVDALEPGEPCRIWATFKPEPLFGIMASKGYRAEAKEMADGSWAVDFVPED